MNLIDTGDFYSMGKNELLVGKALAGARRDKALLSVKFGGLRGPDGAFLGHDARPAATKNFLAHSLSRLGVDHIDIYRPARLDPAVPIEDTIGAIADMVKAGYVRYIGLSEVGVETIRRAIEGAPDLRPADRVLPAQPWPRGDDLPFAHGARHRDDGVRGALARTLDREQADRRERLQGAPAAVLRRQRRRRIAPWWVPSRAWPPTRGIKPAQLAIAWVRAKGAAKNVTIIPTVGARTRGQLADALAGLDVTLTASEVAVARSRRARERGRGHPLRGSPHGDARQRAVTAPES